jgi:hypothetical protein
VSQYETTVVCLILAKRFLKVGLPFTSGAVSFAVMRNLNITRVVTLGAFALGLYQLVSVWALAVSVGL